MAQDYIARFEQAPDVIFGLLIDAERHNRIVPYCKSVAVTERRAAADGRSEIAMHHQIAVQRIAFDAHVRSTLSYRTVDRSLEMISHIGEGNGGLKASGQVSADGTGAQLLLRLDISTMPFRYRILMVEPLLRRAHAKFIEKIARRAAEVGGRPQA